MEWQIQAHCLTPWYIAVYFTSIMILGCFYQTMQLLSVNLPSENHGNLERKKSKSPSERYSSRAVLSYRAFVNCHWNQWGFWWDEEAHATNCASWSNTSENRIWSGPQCANYIWGHYSLAQLLLSVPCRSGESCCLLVLLFPHRRCIRNGPRFHYKSLIHKSFGLNSYYCTFPASLVTPLKEQSEALCHLLQEAYSHPTPASCCRLWHLPPCTMGAFYECCPSCLLTTTALLCVLRMLK